MYIFQQVKVSQQHITFIASFLEKFDVGDEGDMIGGGADDGASSRPKKAFTHRHLERVGQYLRRGEPLDQPVDRSRNLWSRFLKENPDVAALDCIVEPDERSSLLAEYDALSAAVSAVFAEMKVEMTDKCAYFGEVRMPFDGEGGASLACRQIVCDAEVE